MLYQALLEREEDGAMVYVCSKADVKYYVSQGYTLVEDYKHFDDGETIITTYC